MAEELRALYSVDYISHIAHCLAAEADIDPEKFVAFTLADPWNDMSLKERMARLTDGLVHFLPGPFENDITILKRLLPQVSGDVQKYADMLSMFVPDYAVAKGLEKPDLSLDALMHFTDLGTSSEFAIRPFILRAPETVLEEMLVWASHDSADIRRFASEGCRPRLPWAMALPPLKKDPSPLLPILETLRADSSKFVQKSVANNLNDISKDNPEFVLSFADKWLGSDENTDWIIKHGCRTLLKQGNTRALALFGSAAIKVDNPALTLQETNIPFGESVVFSFEAMIDGELPDNLRLEYAIHFMKSNGKTSRKVFKISEKKPVSNVIKLRKAHKFIDYTTRKHYGGKHGVTIIVNGIDVSNHDFLLLK